MAHRSSKRSITSTRIIGNSSRRRRSVRSRPPGREASIARRAATLPASCALRTKRRCLFPNRRGNNRIDSLRNIVGAHGHRGGGRARLFPVQQSYCALETVGRGAACRARSPAERANDPCRHQRRQDRRTGARPRSAATDQGDDVLISGASSRSRAFSSSRQPHRASGARIDSGTGAVTRTGGRFL